MNTITCVYCGYNYLEETPTWGHPVLTEHIKVCPKHPMRQVELDKSKLRESLVGLVGSDDILELRLMKYYFNQIKSKDVSIIKAIDVLLEIRE